MVAVSAASPDVARADARSTDGDIRVASAVLGNDGNAVPHSQHRVAACSLTLLHWLHGFRCSGDAHSLQNLASAGLR